MKLTIRCVSVEAKKTSAEIVVELLESTTIQELKGLIELEQWLNAHTNARFHIDLEGE